MSADGRQDAVDRVTSLLERDLLSLDEYQLLVDRILAVTTETELVAIVDALPVPAVDVLVIECNGGVVKETPHHLPEAIELRCQSGVMKVDLTRCGLDGFGGDVELDIDNGTGVLLVIVPRGVPMRLAEHRNQGGVFKSALRPEVEADGRPRLIVHVRNDTGVIKLRHPRRWWFD